MRGRAAPPHPSIYRIPPGGVVVSKKTSSVPVNDLIDAQEPKRVAFNRWKASKRERRLFKKTVKKKNSTKLKCCRQKRPWLSMNIPPQYKKKPVYPVHPLKSIGRLKIHIGFLKLKYDVWESLLWVTWYWARCNAQTLINRARHWINWTTCSFFLFPRILEQFSFTNISFTFLVQNVVEKAVLNYFVVY